MSTADELRQIASLREADPLQGLLRKAADELEALEQDKARLDHVERQTDGNGWLARASSTGRGFRIHNTLQGWPTAREAIDAHRKTNA